MQIGRSVIRNRRRAVRSGMIPANSLQICKMVGVLSLFTEYAKVSQYHVSALRVGSSTDQGLGEFISFKEKAPEEKDLNSQLDGLLAELASFPASPTSAPDTATPTAGPPSTPPPTPSSTPLPALEGAQQQVPALEDVAPLDCPPRSLEVSVVWNTAELAYGGNIMSVPLGPGEDVQQLSLADLEHRMFKDDFDELSGPGTLGHYLTSAEVEEVVEGEFQVVEEVVEGEFQVVEEVVEEVHAFPRLSRCASGPLCKSTSLSEVVDKLGASTNSDVTLEYRGTSRAFSKFVGRHSIAQEASLGE